MDQNTFGANTPGNNCVKPAKVQENMKLSKNNFKENVTYLLCFEGAYDHTYYDIGVWEPSCNAFFTNEGMHKLDNLADEPIELEEMIKLYKEKKAWPIYLKPPPKKPNLTPRSI